MHVCVLRALAGCIVLSAATAIGVKPAHAQWAGQPTLQQQEPTPARGGRAGGGGGDRRDPCLARPDGDEIKLCHWQLRRRSTIALQPKETLKVTILDANPLIYSYEVAGEAFVEDQSARDAFRSLFAVRTPAAPRQTSPGQQLGARTIADMEKCENRTYSGGAAGNFTCFTEGIQEAAELLIGLVRRTDLSRDTTAKGGRDSTAAIQRELTNSTVPIKPFLSSETTLTAELDARYAALGAPTAEQTARYNATRAASAGVVRFWHEIQRLYLGPLTKLYNYPGGQDELIRLRIRNRLGDSYTPVRPTSEEGVALAVVKPQPHGFEFSTGLAFVAGNRVAFSTNKLKGDTLQVVADTTRDLTIPPSLFLSYLWPLGGATTAGLTAGAGIKDLSQIENSTDLLGGVTLGHEWFRLTLGPAYTSEIQNVPGLDAQNRSTDPNILSRATRRRVARFFLAVHGRF